MIIFLCGPKGSGKDAVAKEFIKLHPEYTTVAFADPIREFVIDLFNLAGTEDYDTLKRSVFETLPGRQVLGREVVRGIGMKMLSYDENQFVEYVENKIIQSDNNILITDCRMAHEFDLAVRLKRQLWGGKVAIVQIRRKGFEYDGHITETEPSVPMDLIIHNDSSLTESVRQLHFFTTGEPKQP